MPGYNHKLSDIESFLLDTNLIKYRACKTGASTQEVTAITGAGDVVKGFSIEDGNAGEQHPIALDSGRILVEAGAAIAADSEVMIDAVGRVVLWAAAAGTNVLCVGKVLEAAGALGDVIPMQLKMYTKQG
jgi:hypothetical protein